MQSVTFKLEGTVAIAVVRVNNKKLTFVGGEARTNLKEGEQHVIQWFMRGAPGSTYKLEITDPPLVKMSHLGTLDADMKDAGVAWILVPEEDGE